MFFGPAVASFTYLSTFLFTSHSTAQNVILFQNFVTGLCLMITSFILGLFDSTRLINMQLKNMYRLFPGFCLGDGLIQLTLCVNDECPTLAETGYTFEKQSVWAWDVIGGDLTFLICEMVIYLAITMAIEYSLSFPSVLAMFTKCFTTDPGLIANSHDCGDDDVDVAAEAARVDEGGEDVINRDIVVLNNLRKVYRGGKVAVQNLSFGIGNGECFGFLGINGAGKTSTLSILSGEFPPTKGGAWIAGYDIKGDQSLIRRKIGYCPQFDALLELLTCEEHLRMYSRIKGVPKNRIDKVVNTKVSERSERSRAQRAAAPPTQFQVVSHLKNFALLNQPARSAQLREMDLTDFADKAAGSLSGGNKRKLSVAIAMIGSPSIVFLDEPSTGMDPVSRRFMWDVISKMR